MNVVLEKDKQGSLGFNIMGGYSVSYMYFSVTENVSEIIAFWHSCCNVT